MLLFYLEPYGDTRTGLVQLVNDKHTLKMCELVNRVRLIEVFADLKIEEKIKEIWMNDPDKFNAERDMRRQRPNFELGMRFVDAPEFRQVVRNYLIIEGKTADFHPNELKKERVKCKNKIYG